jgi:hypothetical protein
LRGSIATFALPLSPIELALRATVK